MNAPTNNPMHPTPERTVSISAIRAFGLHLEAVTRNNSRHGGSGWTYHEEIQLLKDAEGELTYLRAQNEALRGALEKADEVERIANELATCKTIREATDRKLYSRLATAQHEYKEARNK